MFLLDLLMFINCINLPNRLKGCRGHRAADVVEILRTLYVSNEAICDNRVINSFTIAKEKNLYSLFAMRLLLITIAQ